MSVAPDPTSFSGVLPAIYHSSVMHVGRFDPAYKSIDSHEGRGLSVSQHPSAWRHIARLGGHPTHRLSAPDGRALRFLDALSVTEEQCGLLARWAVAAGFAEVCTLYRLSLTNEEGEDCFCLFADEEDAIAELDDPASSSERDRVTPITSVLHSKALAERHGHRDICPAFTQDLILLEAALAAGGFDGVWWDETLDVHSHSAPRGALLPEVVTSLVRVELPEGLDHDDCDALDVDASESIGF